MERDCHLCGWLWKIRTGEEGRRGNHCRQGKCSERRDRDDCLRKKSVWRIRICDKGFQSLNESVK